MTVSFSILMWYKLADMFTASFIETSFPNSSDVLKYLLAVSEFLNSNTLKIIHGRFKASMSLFYT